MTIIDRNHELANVPLREIQGVRIRNRQGVSWRDFSSWKIAKFPLAKLGIVWTELNEFGVLPTNAADTASLSDAANTPAQSAPATNFATQ